tara:strand:- start:292 stop:3651 length:3360 start_codon:yes stop_codon:yes gene_type:complete
MNAEKLEGSLNDLVEYACNFLSAMLRAPATEGLDDKKLEQHWRENTSLNHSGFSWGKMSLKFSNSFAGFIIHNCETPDQSLREKFEEEIKKAKKADWDGFYRKNMNELSELISKQNENVSKDEANKLLRRLDPDDGHNDRKFRNCLEHLNDEGKDAEKTRKDFLELKYAEITHERVYELTEELVRLFDCAAGNLPGDTKLADLMHEFLKSQKKPERHNAWFVVQRLEKLEWTDYVETEYLIGSDGLIAAVVHDNLITINGDGGLGKTALVNEFIRRNHRGQTSMIEDGETIKVEPFEHVIIFSSKSDVQGEYNTLNSSGKLLDPGDPRKSVRGEFLHPGSYEDFIGTICSITRDSKEPGETNENHALRILEDENILVVLDNYEDIESDVEYKEDKVLFEKFLEKWGKKVIKQPKGRVVMTSRTGLEQFRRTGVISMEPLGDRTSKELLKRRYIWLHQHYGTSPSSMMLEQVLTPESKILDQILEQDEMFREQLWGHPLLIQLFAMLLLEEDAARPKRTGSEMVNQVIRRLREGGSIPDVYNYIVKKTVDLMFSEDKDSKLLEILIREENMLLSEKLRKRAPPELSVSLSDVMKFRERLEGLGWIDSEIHEDKGELVFRLSQRYRTQLRHSRGNDLDNENREIYDFPRDLENWEQEFEFESLEPEGAPINSLIGSSNMSDYRLLERIARRLLGEETGARISLEKDIDRIVSSALCNRRKILFDNLILADNIVRKYSRGEIESHSDEVDSAINRLKGHVILSMQMFVRGFGNMGYGWECAVNPRSGHIRQVISRLSEYPDEFGVVKENWVPPFIDGLHEISDRWPIEEISRNHQLDEILFCWGKYISDSEEWSFAEGDLEEAMEYRSWWIEIAKRLWDSEVGINFHLLGGMLSDYLLDQDRFDKFSIDPDEFRGMLLKMQKHPLFHEYVDLERFAEQIGREFRLDNEEDISELNEALPGDRIHVVKNDWKTSKMGGYEEIRMDNQIIINDEDSGPNNSKGEWLVRERDAFGIKVTLLRLEESEESGDDATDEKSPSREEIIEWVESFLNEQEDYITTAFVGHKCSQEFGIKINRYLKEIGEGKLVRFLENSRLGPKLKFRSIKKDPKNLILLEQSDNGEDE